MELCDIRAGDFWDGQSAECGQDEAPQVAAIFFRSTRLQAHRYVFLVKARRQFADGGGIAFGGPISGGVFAVLDGGDDSHRSGARLIAGQYRAGAEAHPPGSSPCTILHHEALASAGHHTDTEAGNALIPDEELSRLRFNSIDSAFGQFWHDGRPSGSFAL